MKINTSNTTYDVLSGITKYALPALATLYFTLSGIWGFPYPEQIIGTVAAIEVFLGVILFLAKRGWVAKDGDFDGDVLVDLQEEGADLLTIAMDRPVQEVRDLDSLKLKVVKNSNAGRHSQE